MKKFSFLASIMMMVMLLGTGCSTQQEGKKAVDLLCEAFDNMAEEVNSVKSIEEFDDLDFNNSVKNLNDIDDSAKHYVLTDQDKEKITESFDGFVDAIVNKLVSLDDTDTLSADMLKPTFNSMKKKFARLTDKAKTLEDFVDDLEDFDF